MVLEQLSRKTLIFVEVGLREAVFMIKVRIIDQVLIQKLALKPAPEESSVRPLYSKTTQRRLADL